jgi:hypothetical protein
MAKELPAKVLQRSKTPATRDPLWEEVRRSGMTPPLPSSELEKYVDLIRVPDLADQDMMSFWVYLRARALNYWLRNLPRKARRSAPAKVPDQRFAISA